MPVSFFKYVGGKQLHMKDLIPYLPPQDKYDTLVDCFFGSGGFLLNHERKAVEVAIDFDPAVSAIHICGTDPILRPQFEKLFCSFQLDVNTLHFYNEFLKKVYSIPREQLLAEYFSDEQKLLRLAVAKLYVLAASFCGLKTTIGRVRMSDSRKRKNVFPFQNPEFIQKYYDRMAGVQVFCGSYEQAEWWDSTHTLFYCDPPYLDLDYYDFSWSEKEWSDFERWARKLKGFVMISSHDHPRIREIFSRVNKWRIYELDLTYMMSKTQGQELLITNYQVKRSWTDSLDFYILELNRHWMFKK